MNITVIVALSDQRKMYEEKKDEHLMEYSLRYYCRVDARAECAHTINC